MFSGVREGALGVNESTRFLVTHFWSVLPFHTSETHHWFSGIFRAYEIGKLPRGFGFSIFPVSNYLQWFTARIMSNITSNKKLMKDKQKVHDKPRLILLGSKFNPFQPRVAFHIETSHLFWTTNQMTGFYMKRNTRMKCIKNCWDCRSAFRTLSNIYVVGFAKIDNGLQSSAVNYFRKNAPSQLLNRNLITHLVQLKL